MTTTGDGISVSLEEIELRIREIVGRRSEFPAADAVGQFGGPSGNSSREFRNGVGRAARVLSELTKKLTTELTAIEQRISITANELVAADESVAGDVSSLQQILGTIDEPAPAAAPAVTSDSPNAIKFT